MLIGTAYQEADANEKAEAWYRELIEKYPKRSEAFSELAQLLENLQRIDDSIDRYRQAAELEFDSEKASRFYERIGNLLIQQDKNFEALKELEQSIQCDSENAGAHYSRATLYEKQENLELAIGDYHKTLEADRKYLSAYLALGRIYKQQNSAKNFNQLIQDIFRHSKDLYSGYLLSAAVYEEVNQPEQAEEQYRQALQDSAPLAFWWKWYYKIQSDRRLKAEALNLWFISLAYHLISKRAQDSVRSDAYIRLLQLLANQGQLDEAIAVCDEMAQQAELAYDADVLRGNLFCAQEKLDEAEQSYKQAIERHLGRPDAYLQLASLYQQQGKLDQAEQTLKQGLSEDVPDDPDLYWMLGQSSEQQQQWEQAINWYQKAANHQFLSEKAAIAFERVGDLLTRQGNDSADQTLKQDFYNQAQKVFQKALLCDPKSAGANFSLGYLDEQKGEWEKALARYHKTIQLDPQYLSAYVSLCRIYGKNRDLAAIERIRGQLKDQMEKLQLDTSSRSQLHVAIAQTYIDTELYERAIEELQNAISIEPDLPDAHISLAWIYEAQARWEKARNEHEIVGQLSSELKPDACLRIGDIFVREDRLNEAEDAYRQAILADPKRPEFYIQLMQFLVNQRHLDEALEICNQMAQQPELAYDAYIWQGSFLEMQENYIDAAHTYQQAIETDPSRADAYLELGRVYVELNRWEEAESALRQAISLAPEQLGIAPNAYLFLADLYRMQGRHPEMQEVCAHVIALVQGAESPDYNLLRQQGLAYFMRGDYTEAEQALNQALESNSADALARFYLALDLLCLRQQDQAKAELQRGIDSTPDPWKYNYAIRDAEILVARTPEVSGAREMLQTLIAARDKSAPASGVGLQRDESQQVGSTNIPGDENAAIPALEPSASDL